MAKRFTVDFPDMGSGDEEQVNLMLVQLVKNWTYAKSGIIPSTVQVSAEDI